MNKNLVVMSAVLLSALSSVFGAAASVPVWTDYSGPAGTSVGTALTPAALTTQAGCHFAPSGNNIDTVNSGISGLTLNTSPTGNCAITGTPMTTTNGTETFALKVTPTAGTGDTSWSQVRITITPTSLAYPQNPLVLTQGVPLAGDVPTIALSGGQTVTYALSAHSSSLPAGLLLNSGTGAITGLPTAGGAADTGTYTIIATDENNFEDSTVVHISVQSVPNYSSWHYSRSITINTSGLNPAIATSQTNYPFLLRLGTANFTFNQSQSDGHDLRFTASRPNGSGGTVLINLPYQIEEWDGTTTGIVWISLDTLYGTSASNAATQSITMYYDSTSTVGGAAANVSNGANVFSPYNGFVSVYHMNGNSTTSSGTASNDEPDVTGNNFHMIPKGGGPTVSPAFIGLGRRNFSVNHVFLKADDSVNTAPPSNGAQTFGTPVNSAAGISTSVLAAGDSLNFPINANNTLSAWVYDSNGTLATSGNLAIISKEQQWDLQTDATGSKEYFENSAYYYDDGAVEAPVSHGQSNNMNATTNGALATGKWQFVVGTTTSTNGPEAGGVPTPFAGTGSATGTNPSTQTVYVNGTAGASTNFMYEGLTAARTVLPMSIGSFPDNNNASWVGSIDEVRVSNISRSYDNIKADYWTQCTSQVTGCTSTVTAAAALSAMPTLGFTSTTQNLLQNAPITTISPTTSSNITSCAAATLPPGLSINSSCQITGTPTALSSATAYTVVASNSSGSVLSQITIAVASPPAAPTIGTATVTGSGDITVTWTDNGSGITGDTARSVQDATKFCTAAGAATSCQVSGLTGGTSYTFQVKSVNAIGASALSSATSALVALTVPAAPTIGTATVTAPEGVTVTWTDNSNGGTAITVDTAISVQDPTKFCTTNGSPTSCQIVGLTGGTSYTFTVKSVNAEGASSVSSATSAVVALDVPGIPSITSVVSSDTAVTVSWTAPASNGGSAITSYTATSSPGGKICTWSTGPLACKVGGLTDSTSYTFKVTATNIEGAGSPSTASSLVIAGAPTVIASPTGQAVNSGVTVKFGVVVTGTKPLIYAWLHAHGGLTDTVHKDTLSVLTDTLTLLNVPLSDTGTYSAAVSNVAGTATSGTAVLSVTPTLPPAISSNPASQTVNSGSPVKFGVTLSSGTSPLVYAWLRTQGGVADTLKKDTLSVLTDTLTNASVAVTDTGTYKVVVSNLASTLASSSATLRVVTTPVAAPSAESFIGSVPVTLATTSGAAIYYTTDGTTPTSGSTLYTGALTFTATTTLKAIALLNSVQSPVMTQVYSLTTVATPTANTPGQVFVGSLKVALSASGGAVIHYTTSGSTPDSTSSLYTDTLTFTSTTTLKAVAVLSGAVSGVFSQTYTLNSPPGITTAPHDTTVLLGAKAGFTVVATGLGTLSYQWQRDGVSVSNSAGHLSGATAATLVDSSVIATDTGTYAVVVTDSLGGTATQTTSSGGRIIINAVPGISAQPSAITKTIGSIGSFTVAATGSGTLSYQWQRDGVNVSNSAGHISGATTATLTDSSVAATDTGTYAVVVTSSLNGTTSSTTSTGAYLTVNLASNISSQPVALTRAVGSIGSFSVTATGTGTLSYQWQKNGVNVVSSAGHISGATTATLTDSSVAVGDTGTYKVVVTNTLNGTSSNVSSNGAYLTVNAPPGINTQPSAITKTPGSIGSFTVVAVGSGTLSYQWLKNGVAVTGSAGHISGATTATLVDSSVAAGDTGTYRVILTNTLNATTASDTSTGAYLTVNAAPGISTQPAALTKAVGSIGNFTVVATGSGTLSYQWLKNGVAVTGSAGHISGATSATLTDSSVAVGDTGTYRVVVMSTLNSTSINDTSTGAYLTVNVAPSITTQPAALTKASGSIGSFTVVAIGSGTLTYQWLKNGVSLSNSTGHISGATSATLVDSSIAAGDTGTYRAVLTNTLNSTTASDTSTGAYLTLNAAPIITTQPAAITKTMGAIGSFTVVATGSGTLSYQWQKNGVGVSNSAGHISGATSATLVDSAVAAGDTGTYRVVLTNTLNASTASDTSSGAYLTISTAAIITSQPVSTKIAAGSNATFSVIAVGGVAPLTYQWFKGSTALKDTTFISGSKTASLTLSSVQGPASDSGRLADSLTVVVTNAGDVGTVTSSIAILTVNALPNIVTPPANSIPSGLGQTATFSVVANKGVSPLIYQWFKNGTPLTDSTGKISGSKTTTLTISHVAATDTGAGLYTVVVANADSVGLVTSNAVNLEPPLALLTEAAKLAAIRMSGSSIVFALPSGVSSAQISLMDIWGWSVWSQSLGHGISQLTWNGNSSGGSGRSGAGFFIVRMILFDAAEHQTGLIERKVAYIP